MFLNFYPCFSLVDPLCSIFIKHICQSLHWPQNTQRQQVPDRPPYNCAPLIWTDAMKFRILGLQCTQLVVDNNQKLWQLAASDTSSCTTRANETWADDSPIRKPWLLSAAEEISCPERDWDNPARSRETGTKAKVVTFGRKVTLRRDGVATSSLCGTQRGCEKSKTFNFKGFAAWPAEGFFFQGKEQKWWNLILLTWNEENNLLC